MGKVNCKNCGEKVRVSPIKNHTQCKSCRHIVVLNHWSIKALQIFVVIIINVMMSIYSLNWAGYVEEITGISRLWSSLIIVAIIATVVFAPILHFLSCFIYDRIKVIHPIDEMVEWDLDKQRDENLPWGSRRDKPN